MTRKRWPIILVLAVLLGLLAPACSVGPNIHQWPADPILVRLEILGASPLVPEFHGWSVAPRFVLYADGHIVYKNNTGSSETLWEVHLSPDEVCSLLGQVERTGFFDYDPDSYQRPEVTDLVVTRLAVDAWRQNAVDAYALEYILDYTPDTDARRADIAPALADSYHLLTAYSHPNAQLYQPERVALRVQPLEDPWAAPLWPLQSPTLQDLAARTPEAYGDLVLQGEEAAAIYTLLQGDFAHEAAYHANGTAYAVAMRPLLPLEAPFAPGEGPWGHRPLPAPDAAISHTVLTCDLTVPVPTQQPTTTLLPESLVSCPLWTGQHPDAPLELIAEWGGFDGSPEKPQALAAGPADRVWIVDGLAGWTKSTRLLLLDSSGNLLQTITALDGKQLSCNDYDVAAAADGSVLIADACQNRIMHLDSTGAVLASWGEAGFGAGQLNLIAGLFLAADDSLYVADSGNQRVLRFALDGEVLEEWAAADLGVAGLGGVARTPDGTFYLLDRVTGAVVVRRADGTTDRWCLPGPEGQKDVPVTIAVDSQRGRVYVGGAQEYLYVLGLDGTYLGREMIDGWGDVAVTLDSTGKVYASSLIYVLVLRPR